MSDGVPPFLVLRDFLEAGEVQSLLDYALDREAAFTPTRVAGEKHDPERRVSSSIRDLAPFRPLFRSRVRDEAGELAAALQASAPKAPKLELELVAHNDGAFYSRHVDTLPAAAGGARPEPHLNDYFRVLSAVYYFHALPRAFSGGALRLFAFTGDRFTDIEPENNSLLVFPSWAPHEVRPVICPSRRFADSRFAINCWVYGKVAARA